MGRDCTDRPAGISGCQPQLRQVAISCAVDRGHVEVAVEGLLEDALMDLDRVDARSLGAAALGFEVAAERRIVGVVSGRGEPIAEVAG
jgi:hypothetical protein